ncbi:MAG: bifunctional metallophosphatase/5'-nucleotidase [Ignavibacteriae bacterium]|nr:MAG: bifunctional metallophosphatase/5'-nucleotidase [Ignavibacteriota bacterium]
MNVKTKLILISLITLVLSTTVIFAQTVKIKLIETSDVHGAIFPYDFQNDTTTNSSIAQVHTYVNGERRNINQEVILLDNGDILQGDPAVYYYNYEDTVSKHLYADVMNMMEYDAATIGNHDIETGHPVYDRFRKQLSFPWLSANVVNTSNNEPYFEPYTIIEKEGVKIAILGLITPAIPNWLPAHIWEGMVFEDMIESAKKWVAIIREKENPDLLIGLFHAGVDYTYSNLTADTYKNENASRLVAEKIPGFDVVFVGHDHAGWNFNVVNTAGDSVLILGPLSRAKTVAVANITMLFNDETGKWDKINSSGEIVEVKDYRPDNIFMNKYLLELNRVENYVVMPLGQIKRTVSSKESIFGPSEFVDLIHIAQFDITGADISFASPLSFNVTLDSGWVRVRDMFNLYKYENFLYTMELTGQEVKDYLEYSFGNWFNQMENDSDHVLKFTRDENGSIQYSERYGSPMLEERFYNYSSASGLEYTVDISKPVGERVAFFMLRDSTKFSLDSTYTVAINSYRGNGGGGHLIRGAGIPKEELAARIIHSTDTDLRLQIMNWIKEKKKLYPRVIGNWYIKPENWWKNGKEIDYKLLFSE